MLEVVLQAAKDELQAAGVRCWGSRSARGMHARVREPAAGGGCHRWIPGRPALHSHLRRLHRRLQQAGPQQLQCTLLAKLGVLP